MKKIIFLNRNVGLVQALTVVSAFAVFCFLSPNVSAQAGFGGGPGFGDSGVDNPGGTDFGDTGSLEYPGGPLTPEEFESFNPTEKANYIAEYGSGFTGPSYEIPTLNLTFEEALKGQRVEDAYINRTSPNEPLVLDDVRRIKITEDELDQYSDAGNGIMGDSVAGDGFYTNTLPPSKNEFMGAQSFYSLSRKMDLLVGAQGMNILDYFGLTAASTDRLSTLPNVLDLIERRDREIYRVNEAGVATGWVDSFLADYRLRQDDLGSDFFPLYVPRPPEPPAIPPPPAPWRPAGYEPTPLDLAIDNYLNEAFLDPEITEDADVLREQLMIQLEDPEFKKEFLEKYSPPPEPEGGEMPGNSDQYEMQDYGPNDEGGQYYRPGSFGT